MNILRNTGKVMRSFVSCTVKLRDEDETQGNVKQTNIMGTKTGTECWHIQTRTAQGNELPRTRLQVSIT